MSKWEKLLERVRSLSGDVRFEELKRILERYGYIMTAPSNGSSHFTFRKNGYPSITIPKHNPVKKHYVRTVKDAIENEEADL